MKWLDHNGYLAKPQSFPVRKNVQHPPQAELSSTWSHPQMVVFVVHQFSPEISAQNLNYIHLR
jgi:hypothetical protein